MKTSYVQWKSEGITGESQSNVLSYNTIFSYKLRDSSSLLSEVEGELGQLFSSKGANRKNQDRQSGNDTKFEMLVEDLREGVLVSS